MTMANLASLHEAAMHNYLEFLCSFYFIFIISLTYSSIKLPRWYFAINSRFGSFLMISALLSYFESPVFIQAACSKVIINYPTQMSCNLLQITFCIFEIPVTYYHTVKSGKSSLKASYSKDFLFQNHPT